MLIPSCTGVSETQSNLVFNHWNQSASSPDLQQHDETPPESALKMAAGFDKKTRNVSCSPAAVCVQETCCLFKTELNSMGFSRDDNKTSPSLSCI